MSLLSLISEEFRLFLVTSFEFYRSIRQPEPLIAASAAGALSGDRRVMCRELYTQPLRRVNPMKRKVRLKIQTVRRESITVARGIFTTYCASCGREGEMLSRTHAAAILAVEEDVIDALISGGVVHTVEMITGNQRICKNSLLARTKYDRG